MDEKQPSNGLAIASLILGIASLSCMVLVWIVGGIGVNVSSTVAGVAIAIGIIGLISGIVGIILGVMAKKAGDISTNSTVGLILSAAGALLCMISLAGCVGCMACTGTRRATTSIMSLF